MKFTISLIFLFFLTFQSSLAFDFSNFNRKNPSAVKALQTFLNTQGASLKIDGVSGSQTMKALRQFQLANNLTNDGVIGEKTSSAIHKIQPPTAESRTNNKDAKPTKSDTNQTSGTSDELDCDKDGCKGRGRATTFNHSTVACPGGQRNPYNECYGAISLDAAKQFCKGKNQKCYCGKVANVSVNGKSIPVKILDVGAKTSNSTGFANGVVLDITPNCVAKSGFGGACRGGTNNVSCYDVQVTLDSGSGNGKIQVAEKK